MITDSGYLLTFKTDDIPVMGVKASGGVRSYEDLMTMVEAGATRIGASAGIAIMEAAKALKGDANE